MGWRRVGDGRSGRTDGRRRRRLVAAVAVLTASLTGVVAEQLSASASAWVVQDVAPSGCSSVTRLAGLAITGDDRAITSWSCDADLTNPILAQRVGGTWSSHPFSAPGRTTNPLARLLVTTAGGHLVCVLASGQPLVQLRDLPRRARPRRPSKRRGRDLPGVPRVLQRGDAHVQRDARALLVLGGGPLGDPRQRGVSSGRDVVVQRDLGLHDLAPGIVRRVLRAGPARLGRVGDRIGPGDRATRMEDRRHRRGQRRRAPAPRRPRRRPTLRRRPRPPRPRQLARRDDLDQRHAAAGQLLDPRRAHGADTERTHRRRVLVDPRDLRCVGGRSPLPGAAG